MSRGLHVLATLARFGRRHRALLAKGCLAASLVIGARLLLPWPLHALMDHWKAVESGKEVASHGILGLERPIALGLGFLAALVILGLGDALERVLFAKFAIGMVRDVRQAAIQAALRPAVGEGPSRPGDLVARLVGDTARLKAGLKGFLVHVATNGVLFVGVTLVLLRVNLHLGLVFGLAGLGTLALTLLGGRAMYHRSGRYRRKEGRLADEIDKALRKQRYSASFESANRSSGHHEAWLTRIQARTTWGTYAVFGLAILAAVALGSRDIEAGRLDAHGLLVFLVYALIIRGPMVRLARQGSRLGKTLAVADRLVQVLDSRELPSSPRTELALVAGEPGTTEKEAADLMTSTKLRVLFTGYAPVHFLCFRPLFDRLRAIEGVEVRVSGGLEMRGDGVTSYDHAAMYGPLGIEPELVLPVDEMRREDFDVLFAGNTTLLLPRSVATKVQIFHGVSFRNRSVRSANMGCDFYFVVGPYQKRRFHENGLMTEGDPREVEIGFMKTDRLVNGELNRDELVTALGFDGSRPVLLYAPTGQKYNSLETMGVEVLERLTAADRYDVILKPHDHAKNDIDWFARLSRFESPHCSIVRDLDVIPLLAAADLLISDASSVSNEYLLLDRPIVFLDVPKLIKRSKAKVDAAVDLDTWGRRCGVVVAGPEGVVAAVDESLADPGALSEVRCAAAADLFFNPGRATDAACAWFRSTFLAADERPSLASGER